MGGSPKILPSCSTFPGSVGSGRILDWRTEMWLPQATRGLPNIPLLGPEAAGLDQVQGLNAGLISQNGDPPYTVTGGPAVRP
jgi:nicotinate dehydrogenase subunit B